MLTTSGKIWPVSSGWGSLRSLWPHRLRSACIARPVSGFATWSPRTGSRETQDRVPEVTALCPQGDVSSAVFFRDSFLRPIPLLAQHFRESTYCWQHGLDGDKVRKAKARVVVQEMVERALMLPRPVDIHVPTISPPPGAPLTRSLPSGDARPRCREKHHSAPRRSTRSLNDRSCIPPTHSTRAFSLFS